MEVINSSSHCEIISSRMLDAHQERVYKAWTDPEHLKNWWGPKNVINTFHEFDLQNGGKWIFTMYGPDKKEYNHSVEFIQVVAPELMIWKHLSDPPYQVVAIFSERPGHKTELTFKMIFEDQATCDKFKITAVPANEEMFYRLEQELKKINDPEV